MTIDEYYSILAECWQKVDQNNLAQIRAYNEFKRELRKILDEEKYC